MTAYIQTFFCHTSSRKWCGFKGDPANAGTREYHHYGDLCPYGQKTPEDGNGAVPSQTVTPKLVLKAPVCFCKRYFLLNFIGNLGRNGIPEIQKWG